MTNFIQDPEQNYTLPRVEALGVKIPEYTFLRFIASELLFYRKEADRDGGFIDQAFATVPPEAVRGLKGFLRDHPNFHLAVNWPRPDAHLPLISVVSRSEEPDQSFLGDILGLARVGEASGGRQVVRRVRGAFEKRAVDVLIGSQEPETTLFLHCLIKLSFFAFQAWLAADLDVQDLAMAGRDFRYDPSILPQPGFYKTLSLSFRMMFDYVSRETPAQLVDVVGLRVTALSEGEVVDTLVPGEQG